MIKVREQMIVFCKKNYRKNILEKNLIFEKKKSEKDFRKKN